MVRSVLIGALLVALGAAAARFLMSSPAADEQRARAPSAPRSPLAARTHGGGQLQGDDPAADLEQRIRQLEAKLAAESAQRRYLEQRLEAVTAQLAADTGEVAASANRPAAVAAMPLADEPPAPQETPAIDPALSEMERALVAAGLDTTAATEIKRRGDELAMAEMYLRERATREQWLDTPRFREEMAALNAEQVPLRDEIGDELYDRYLLARGQANRVRVDDVLMDSPAAQAGLQNGDLIVRYGEDRIFVPAELVARTRVGGDGETVRLEIIRNGERLEIEVPRGPLGLRVAPTQVVPETG